MTDREPGSFEHREDDPMWESDVEEREARKRKLIVFGGSAAAVLVGFVGLYALLSWVAGGLTDTPDTTGQRSQTEIVAPDETTVDAPPPVEVADVATADELDWYAVEAPLGFAERVFADGDTFYALSTIPGQVVNWPAPKAIYTSNDGENWDLISLDNALYPTDMAMSRGSIYLIGTAPDSGGFDEPAQIEVASSADGGETWLETLLPTVATPPAGAPIEWSNVTTRIGANQNAVVAAVQSQFFLDYRMMVPTEFIGDNYGYNPTADGVDVVDYMLLDQAYSACEQEMGAAGGDDTQVSDECRALFNGDQSIGAIGSVTWEEMGLEDGSPPVFAEMFVSTDGTNFEAVDSPFAPGSELQTFHTSESGFYAVEWNQGRQVLWASADGRTWDTAEGIQGFDWITSLGTIGGRTVVVGQSGQTAQAAWENDSGDWDTVDLNEVLGAPAGQAERYLSAAGVGPLGVVAVFQSYDERIGREFTDILMGTGPDTWSIVPVEEITGLSGGYSDWVVVGPTSVLLHYQVYNQFGQRNLQVIGAAG